MYFELNNIFYPIISNNIYNEAILHGHSQSLWGYEGKWYTQGVVEAICNKEVLIEGGL